MLRTEGFSFRFQPVSKHFRTVNVFSYYAIIVLKEGVPGICSKSLFFVLLFLGGIRMKKLGMCWACDWIRVDSFKARILGLRCRSSQ